MIGRIKRLFSGPKPEKKVTIPSPKLVGYRGTVTNGYTEHRDSSGDLVGIVPVFATIYQESIGSTVYIESPSSDSSSASDTSSCCDSGSSGSSD